MTLPQSSKSITRLARGTLHAHPSTTQPRSLRLSICTARPHPHQQHQYHQSLRALHTSPRRFTGPKRQLMTDSLHAYRPASLEPVTPVPPRNVTAPEATAAAAAAAAPASRPGPASPAAASQQQPTGRKSRLRSRKAAMTLTAAAVEHIRALLEGPDPKLIRVGVKNKGCSGSAYHLEYVDAPGKFDELIEQDGVKVLVDSKALIKVLGSEMDWVEDKLSARFTFKNPNITEQCGCGESFSIG